MDDRVAKDRIRPAKLADAIAAHLESLILEGSLRPGDRLLAERDLAQKLDVSRPSLREALDLLEHRGMLHSGRGGTCVSRLLGEEFSAPLLDMLEKNEHSSTYDYLEFRGAVEGTATYFAALRASEIDREMVHTHFAAMEAAHSETANDVASDPGREADADSAFHLSIYEASHNLMMLHVMGSLRDVLHRDVLYNRGKLYTRKGVRILLLEQHRAIHDAILSGDAEAARAAAEAHVAFTKAALHEIDKSDSRLEKSLRRIVSNAPDEDQSSENMSFADASHPQDETLPNADI
jgi:GntR family transcriptional repressor for pyruvate dehydrogenase complex